MMGANLAITIYTCLIDSFTRPKKGLTYWLAFVICAPYNKF